MNQAFREYSEVTITEPLRQGDILESADLSVSKWSRNLVVLTTDCDFAHRKHHGRITCVPIMTANEYLLEFAIPDLQTRLLEKLVKEIRTILQRAGKPAISDKRLRDWPTEVPPETIVTELGLDGNDAGLILKAMQSIQAVNRQSEDLPDAIATLITANLASPSPKSRENVIKDIRERLSNHYKNPPGDALFVSAIGNQYTSGYFAYLRHMEQVWEESISISPSHRRTHYRRIARLQDRYIHAIAQRFAMVFVSIGLPDEYEEVRNLSAELLTEELK